MQPSGSLGAKISELNYALAYLNQILAETPKEIHHHRYLTGAEATLADLLAHLKWHQMILDEDSQ